MNNNIYCVFPASVQKIKFKNYMGTLFLLGRLYSFWNKKKKPVKIRRTFLLKNLTFLSKYTLWLYLKELQTKNVITISKKDYDNDTMIIDFTDDFIKNYVNAEVDAETETEGIDEIDPEDIEECDNEDIEDQKIDYSSTEQEEDYQVLEMLEEASNFDYSKLKPSDFLPNDFITNDGIFCDRTYTNDDNTKFELYPFFSNDDDSPMTIKQLIELKKKGDLNLEIWKDFKKYFLPEWENLKAKGLV